MNKETSDCMFEEGNL